MKNIFLIVLIIFINCNSKNDNEIKQVAHFNIRSVQIDPIRKTNGFDFPVGKPDTKGYYNAQEYGNNNHLGDDWNGINGGNTDLGDPIYSIANGYVSFAKNIGGGWGNVIRIIHHLENDNQIESLYAHCLKINVNEGDYINKGDIIGTIGNNDDNI